MQFLIKEKQKMEINKHLALFCSLDEERDTLLSLICDERKNEINALTSLSTINQGNQLSEPILVGALRLIHPENLASMLIAECPAINSIILRSIPEELSRKVQFYFPPEVLSKINAMPASFNIDSPDVIFERFANQIIQNFNKCYDTISNSDKDSAILSKLITLSYEEILVVLKSAGEFALNTKSKLAGRNEILFAGYTLLAGLIAKQSEELKKIILEKFSQETQKILNSLFTERREEIKCLRQKSEEIFRLALEMS